MRVDPAAWPPNKVARRLSSSLRFADTPRCLPINWNACGLHWATLKLACLECRINQDNVRYYIGIHTGSDGLQTNYGTRYSSEVHDFVVNAIATL